MRVLALSDSLAPWHSFWIRVGQYLPALPWPTTISQDPSAITELQRGDRLVLYRYAPGWGDLANQLRIARQRGVVILSDLDDYLWQAVGWNQERLLGCTRALRECQTLTCSTESLRDQLLVMFPQQRVLLLPNSAAKLPSTVKQVPAPPLRIGWTGAPWTRRGDLELLTPIAQWIARRPGALQLVHIGHGDGRLSLAGALGLQEWQVETHPLQSHSSYLEQLNFDIGLAPLSSTSFNYYKSAIKVIEYSSMGIPWIASDAEPYRSLCRQWKWNGRLCSTPEAWIAQLVTLIDEQQRLQEGEQLKALCATHNSYEHGVKQWITALTN